MITSPPRKSCRVIIQAAASRPKCSGGCRLSRLRGPRLHRDSLAARAIAPSRARLIPPAPFRIAAAASRSKTSRPPAPTRAPRSSAARPAAGWPRTTTRPSPSSLRRCLSRPLNGLRGRHCFTSQISFPFPRCLLRGRDGGRDVISPPTDDTSVCAYRRRSSCFRHRHGPGPAFYKVFDTLPYPLLYPFESSMQVSARPVRHRHNDTKRHQKIYGHERLSNRSLQGPSLPQRRAPLLRRLPSLGAPRSCAVVGRCRRGLDLH